METTGPTLGATLFGSAYRRQVLALLFLHPDTQYHTREIARITATSPGTLHRELRRLGDAGLLNRRRVGNQVLYCANRDVPVFAELRGILRKTVGVVDVLKGALAPLADRIAVAFVFGSVAKGVERAGSDVDVMVVGAASFAEVVSALAPAGRAIGREVNPVVYGAREFAAGLRRRDPFLARVLKEPQLLLIGDRAGLRELSKS